MKKTILLATILVLAAVPFAKGQTDTFTYQGRLNQNGSPANGTFDFVFAVYNQAVFGTLIAGPVTNTAVTVNNGLFSTGINMGTNVFTGGNRWLEIYIIPGGGSLTLLNPRQPITSAPYAIRAANAETALNYSGPVAAANLTGTVSDARLSTNVALLNGGANFSGTVTANNFIGNGSGLSGLWNVSGNSGTTAGNFIGTSDNQALEVKVNSTRAFRIEPNVNGAPNIIGGAPGNFISPGVFGSVIAGGGASNYQGITYSNRTDSLFSSIGGGRSNTIETNSLSSVIGGGFRNLIQGYSEYATIAGGQDNTIETNADYAVIAGGQLCSIAEGGSHSTIGGGIYSSIERNASSAAIVGGINNTIKTNGYNSFIGGGIDNTIGLSAFRSFIGGGIGNTNSAERSFIGGGWNNNIRSNAQISVIVGGFGNVIQTNVTASAIGGGGNNNIGMEYGTISGGLGNFIRTNSGFSTIGGGYENFIYTNAIMSVIAGGYQNRITNDSHCAMIPGGSNNVAAGFCSFAAGRSARALHPGTFVWGDTSTTGVVASVTANSVTMRAAGGVRIFSNSTGTLGVTLATNATSWSAISDRNAKKNFAPINGEEVLEKLASVPIQKWNYKWDSDNDVPHIGPMAQDFKAAFYPGRDDKQISTLEFDGVELAAIQGLNQKIKTIEQENGELKKRLADLEKLITSMVNK